MGSVDVTTCRHRHRLFTTFITMKLYSVISQGVIIGQSDNVMFRVMQSVPAHPNITLFCFGLLYNRPLAIGAKPIPMYISCIVVSPFFLSVSYLYLGPLLWNCAPCKGRWSVKSLAELEQEVDSCCVAVWCIAEQNSLL